jgi:predicted DNA-binding protein
MKHFRLSLPEPLRAQLMQAARSTGRTATQLARQAIEAYLAQQREDQLNVELDAYIARNAGTPFDLDTEFEAAGVAHLLT